MQERIASRALDALRAAHDALQRKGSAGDYDAYASFAKALAKRVAEAAKEGGFLGFGGERVSEGERADAREARPRAGSARVGAGR